MCYASDPCILFLSLTHPLEEIQDYEEVCNERYSDCVHFFLQLRKHPANRTETRDSFQGNILLFILHQGGQRQARGVSAIHLPSWSGPANEATGGSQNSVNQKAFFHGNKFIPRQS